MKFSKLDLLTLLISLFLFSSCKDSSTVGLDIDPGNAITGTLLDNEPITSTTLTDIPTSTYSTGTGLVRYPLGQMNDPVFGKTEASLALSVNLPDGAYSFGKGVTIDSAILVMRYERASVNQFYGDSTARYSITVNQLTDNLSLGTGFLSSKDYAAGDQLGTFSAAIKPNSRVNVTEITTGGPDSVKSKAPQLRIKLDKTLIQNKIAALDSATLSTNAKFNAAFKGLKVRATVPSGSKGGVMFLDFVTDSSGVMIYYKRQNATTSTAIDTVAARFPIVTTTNAVAATIKHDYTGTPVQTQLDNPATQYQITYLQALGGIRNKISFPTLKDLTTKLGSKIVINKADLVIDLSDNTDADFAAPLKLALYRYDIANQRQLLPDNNPYDQQSATGDVRAFPIPGWGVYDAVKKTYTFTITNYVQDIIDGKTIDYGTFLAPASVTSVNATATTESTLLPWVTSAARGVIGSFNNTNNDKIRLNIYYVKAGI
jgi:hypothetical protein